MIIGLIAYDARKKLIQNFYVAYRGIPSKNILYAIGATGRLVEEVANLNIHECLAGHSGGTRQMAAQIEHDGVDLVISLGDPNDPEPHEPDVNNVVHLCNIYSTSLVADLVPAELLIKALDRGDTKWREAAKQ